MSASIFRCRGYHRYLGMEVLCYTESESAIQNCFCYHAFVDILSRKEVIGLDSLQIGKYLSVLRKYYKITQDELASRLNVTRQAISKWETGVTIPDIELLMRLSEIYGVSINDILKADTASIKYQKEMILTKFIGC